MVAIHNHTQLLNFLIDKFGLKSYCEIGISIAADNFDKINCTDKIGIDPDINAKADFVGTSDEFFEQNNKTYDLFFIDGLHHKEQVKKDFDNSMRCLNYNGFIVIHDCNPLLEIYTHVPRDNKAWTGNVYQFCCSLSKYDGIDFLTLPFDWGCCIIWKDETKKGSPIEHEINWEYFSQNRRKLLRMINNIEIYFEQKYAY